MKTLSISEEKVSLRSLLGSFCRIYESVIITKNGSIILIGHDDFGRWKDKIAIDSGLSFVDEIKKRLAALKRHRLKISDDKGKFAGITIQQKILKCLEDDFYHTTAKVKHIIKKIKHLISYSTDSTVKDVLKKMVSNSISSVPVIDKGKAVGIITEKDIVPLSKEKIRFREKAEAFMSSPVITVSYETPLTEAVKIVNGSNIRRVIITGKNGKAEGIITDKDLLRNIEGDYNTFIELKLPNTKDILNLIPEMLIEIIDKGKNHLVICINGKVTNRPSNEIVEKPVTALILAEKWDSVYRMLLKVGKVEDIKFKKNSEMFEFSGFSIDTEGKSKQNRIQLIILDIMEDVKLYTTDPLTGLYNRFFLNEFVTKELEISKQIKKKFSLATLKLRILRRLMICMDILPVTPRCLKHSQTLR